MLAPKLSLQGWQKDGCYNTRGLIAYSPSTPPGPFTIHCTPRNDFPMALGCEEVFDSSSIAPTSPWEFRSYVVVLVLVRVGSVLFIVGSAIQLSERSRRLLRPVIAIGLVMSRTR
jgi:hypothetical protein